MYSPLDMSAEEAFQRACEYMDDENVVVIHPYSVEILAFPTPNTPRRLIALPGMYLVRVEIDGSLRTVHQNIK